MVTTTPERSRVSITCTCGTVSRFGRKHLGMRGKCKGCGQPVLIIDHDLPLDPPPPLPAEEPDTPAYEPTMTERRVMVDAMKRREKAAEELVNYTSDKYQFAVAYIRWCRGAAILVVLLTLIAAVTGSFNGTHAGWLLLIPAVISAFVTLVFADFMQVFVDIEKNTRRRG